MTARASDAIYNEIEPYAANWLDNLIARGHIAPGRVERRSIADLKPADVAGPGQRHFFAGIGGWSLALRLAGIPDDADVWTGSCPCQPFSDAGKRSGTRDARHLWPTWFELIRECRPPAIFGEQVASRAGLAWFDAVRADLERCGYAVGASDLCAASVGAPHIRQRLFFVAYARDERREGERLRIQPGESRSHGHEVGGGQPDSRSSWATPAAREAGGTPEGFLMRKRKAKAKGAELGESLTSLSMQAAWATPTTAASGNAWSRDRGQPGKERLTLTGQARAAKGWPTPLRSDGEHATASYGHGNANPTLLGAARAASGRMSSGSTVLTAKRGQLNPDLSRWLMGYPVAWLFAAPSNKPTPRFKKRSTGTTERARSQASATRSSRKSAPSSSRPRKRREGR